MTLTITAANISWQQVAGSTGYELHRNGKKVASFKPSVLKASTATVASGDTLTIVAVPSGQQQAAVVTAVPPVTPPPTPPPSGNGSVAGRWFTDASPWNIPVGASPRIDANTDAYMKLLGGMGIFWNGSPAANGEGSTPVYLADASTPIVQINVTRGGLGKVPLPYQHGWNVAGVDAHLAVLRTDTGDYWESQDFNPSTLTAYAIAQGNVITGQGIPTSTQNISVLPTVAGLIRPQYVGTGLKIPYALRVAIPCASNTFVPPAIYSDGRTVGGIPSGKRLWLPPGYTLGTTDPFVVEVADALNTYGMLIGDSNQGNAITGYVESTVDGSIYGLPLTSFPASVVAQMKVLAT